MYSYVSKDVKALIAQYTGKFMAEQAEIDAKAAGLFAKDPFAARAFLTEYCNSNVVASRDAWWALLDELFRKYDMTNIYDKVTEKRLPIVWDEDFVRTMVKADPPGQAGEIPNN